MWPYLPFTAIALPLPCLACCCWWPLPNARTSVQEQLLCNLDIVWFKSIFAHCNWNMSEKLRLHWNDFQENINVLFGNLRGNGEFSDVTLACEDGQQFEGHNVVLAASSPVFQNLLKMSKLQNHPLLIYMRGIKSEASTQRICRWRIIFKSESYGNKNQPKSNATNYLQGNRSGTFKRRL